MFWKRNKREAHFGSVVRFTISRSVITCTVREFNKLWVCSLQPDTRVALTNIPDGSACTAKLIIIKPPKLTLWISSYIKLIFPLQNINLHYRLHRCINYTTLSACSVHSLLLQWNSLKHILILPFHLFLGA